MNASSVNSTTYVDVVGLLMGETRLPAETSPVFLARLERIAQSRADHSYKGALEQVSAEMGYPLEPYVNVSSTVAGASIVSSLSGLVLSNPQETVTLPLVTMDLDTTWRWSLLSALVSAVNQTATFQATLLVADGLALQLAQQGNQFAALNEPIVSLSQKLLHPGYVAASGVLSDASNSFTVTGQQLVLTGTPIAGLLFSYQYRIQPYDLVGSPIGLLGLLDSGFAAAAIQPDGTIAYQAREFLSSIFAQDASYWGR